MPTLQQDVAPLVGRRTGRTSADEDMRQVAPLVGRRKGRTSANEDMRPWRT
ncbi:hypothetical protein J9303_05530 [Bacillaceae bacterium Marseille-Q3522]|nr:hypothetical protein [Bacillaceae bacterium Marseille-Q3522]